MPTNPKVIELHEVLERVKPVLIEAAYEELEQKVKAALVAVYDAGVKEGLYLSSKELEL